MLHSVDTNPPAYRWFLLHTFISDTVFLQGTVQHWSWSIIAGVPSSIALPDYNTDSRGFELSGRPSTRDTCLVSPMFTFAEVILIIFAIPTLYFVMHNLKRVLPLWNSNVAWKQLYPTI